MHLVVQVSNEIHPQDHLQFVHSCVEPPLLHAKILS